MDESNRNTKNLTELPARRIDQLLAPVSKFLHIEAAGGVVLLVCTLIALGLANSPLADWFIGLWAVPLGFSVGDWSVSHSLKHWINDGVMTVFFFVIGLEVKREIVLGELKSLRQATLPVAAALGGMIVPAAMYLVFASDGPEARGWGIPMATDIAFMIGCVALLGKRVPHSFRVFLLSLAIVDDIGAILVIAIGYTDNLNLIALGLGVAGIVAVTVAARFDIREVPFYAVLGIGIWFAFHESGIHATLAGVILGLLTPAKRWVTHGRVGGIVQQAKHLFHGGGSQTDEEVQKFLKTVNVATREAISPLERLESALHPWVGFVIMPLFALANAGVPLEMAELGKPAAFAVMAGLVIGKPLGIFLFSWITVKLRWGQLPEGVSWGMLMAGGCLAGIGFTMALFIAGLALAEPFLTQAKIGILFGSATSAVIGMGTLVMALNRRKSQAPSGTDNLQPPS